MHDNIQNKCNSYPKLHTTLPYLLNEFLIIKTLKLLGFISQNHLLNFSFIVFFKLWTGLFVPDLQLIFYDRVAA